MKYRLTLPRGFLPISLTERDVPKLMKWHSKAWFIMTLSLIYRPIKDEPWMGGGV